MRKLWILFIISVLSGCTKSPSPQTQAVLTAEISTTLPLYYVTESKNASPFEPKSGCMSGAFITNDLVIDGNLGEFEKLTNKSHDVYGFSMKTNSPFPMTWILDCFTHNKIPMVSLYPQNPNMPFDITSVEVAARTLSTFRIPMIVEFYPNASSYGDSQDYIAFYQKAREIFKRVAPQAAFVWSVTPGLDNQGASFYPGDEYTDWIGLSLYIDSQTEPETAVRRLGAWCYAWQSRKPLMVKAAVSHYSTETTVYTEQESAGCLLAIYEEIQKFPRIQLVMYVNENLASGAPVKIPRENYLITDNQVMLAAYQTAVADNHFILKEETDNNKWLKSPFDAIELNGRIFLPVNAIQYELETTVIAPIRQIDGRQYISQDALNRYKTEKNDKKVYLSPSLP